VTSWLRRWLRRLTGEPRDSDSLVGFPDFQETVRQAYPRFFEVAPFLLDSSNELLKAHYRAQTDLGRTMLHLCRFATSGMAEIVLLACNGHGVGSLKVLRSVFETTVNAVWLREHPEELGRFLKWHFVENHRDVEYRRKHGFRIDADAEALDKDFHTVAGLFEVSVKNGKERLPRDWSRHSFLRRVEETELTRAYVGLWRSTSWAVHGTIGGLAAHMRVSEDGTAFEFREPPCLDFTEPALLRGHMCTMFAIGAAADVLLSSGAGHLLARLKRDFEYAWQGFAEAATAAK